MAGSTFTRGALQGLTIQHLGGCKVPMSKHDDGRMCVKRSSIKFMPQFHATSSCTSSCNSHGEPSRLLIPSSLPHVLYRTNRTHLYAASVFSCPPVHCTDAKCHDCSRNKAEKEQQRVAHRIAHEAPAESTNLSRERRKQWQNGTAAGVWVDVWM